MIKKVNAAGNSVLPKALAGCVFDVREQADGSIQLHWVGKSRGKSLQIEPMPMPKNVIRKLSLHLGSSLS